MSGEPNTPLQSNGSKKRELPSPEFDNYNKKNRILLDSSSESDISGLGANTIASNMSTTNLPSSNPSSQLTLRDLGHNIVCPRQDEDLQKIASYMKESFQTQVAEITQENENRQLQQRIQQMETAADKAIVF